MTRRFVSPRIRPFTSSFSAIILTFVVVLCGLNQPLFGQGQGPKIYLDEAKQYPVAHITNGGDIRNLKAEGAKAVSLAAGDFNEDGYGDLVAGYGLPGGSGVLSVHFGNINAFAPQDDASFQSIANANFPSPYLPNASVFDVPVKPDFIAVGDFNGDSHLDLAIAAKGGNALYILLGLGNGRFSTPYLVNLPGPVTVLAAGAFGHNKQLIVGTGSSLMVFAGFPEGITDIISYPLQQPATQVVFGPNLSGHGSADAAIVIGNEVAILAGDSLQLQPVSLPVGVSQVVLGDFIEDRTHALQMALLGSDGNVSFAVRSSFDPRPLTLAEFQAIRRAKMNHQPDPVVPPIGQNDSWSIIETIQSGAPTNNNSEPIVFRSRISDQPSDDVTILDPAAGGLVFIVHKKVPQNATTFVPGSVSVLPHYGTPVAALPLRVNIDGRAGIVALNQGQIAAEFLMPLPDPTFTVNRNDDPTPISPITNACNGVANDCSLREAVLRANALAGTDTIMVPAGTFSLTIGRSASPAYDATTGTLNINDSVNIIGNGQATTIITWGTPTGGTVDMVMSVNEDIASTTTATASISNLTIQNGVNHGSSGLDGDGGCMEFDTGTNGTANLTLTNVTLQNCSTLQGGGGGIVMFNFVTPTGLGFTTISNSTIQGNSAVQVGSAGAGGGIAISNDAFMVMTNSHVLNNNAIQNFGPGTQFGTGGGIIIFSPQNVAGASAETQIHNSTISGNKSAGFGGGIWNAADFLIDQGSVISGNTAGFGVAGQEGGGLYLNTPTAGNCPTTPTGTCTSTLTKVTITGNTATGNGGGVSNGSGSASGSMTMSFSRLAGNTTSGGLGSNLNNNHATATVTNNWWGTNDALSTINSITATTTFDPFIVLTHNGSPQEIRINASSTLTGDMSKDNHGNGATLSGNLNEIIGLPITFNGAVLGTIPQPQPETLNASAQATATFNAGGTSGFGTANATVDQAVVPVNSNLIASATEAGTTATITTVGAHGYSTGEFVKILGVGVSGYNSNIGPPGPPIQYFPILSTPTATTFTYTANASGLGASSGGTVNADIVILQPPAITKSFNPTTIQTTAGTGTTVSTITFSITNGNVVPIDGSFTDTLPTNVGTVPGNLVVATTPNVVNNCGGSVTATAGSGSISFTNAALAVGTCTIQVNVQSSVDNTYSNSVTIDSTAAGNGNTAIASPSLTVINPPTIAKVFGAATIPLNGTTSLTFTISSTDQNQTLSGIAFTDSLPSGLVVATPNGLTSTCTGTATATAGSGTASLSSASLAPGASCTVSLNVTGTTAGVKSNSVTVSDTTAGTGNTASANITVVAPPTIAKAFGAASIPLNGTTTLTFTVTNPNATTALTGIGFSDTVPAGLTMIGFGSGGDTCGGVTSPGASTVSYSALSVAASSSCFYTVTVKGIAAGTQNNTTGAITSTEGGTGTTSNTATLTVVAPPSIAKAFGAAAISLNGTTSLTFTITNPAANTVAETGVAFADTLPTGLVVATPNGLTNTCGGTATAVAGSTSISLTAGTIAVNSSCTVVVNVTGTTSGLYTNTTGAVSSTNGGTGNTASANLTVALAPTITKSFNASTMPVGGQLTLTFNITNPNTNVALTGVAFTDTFPAGLLLFSPPGATNSCGGTLTAVSGAGSVSLSGGTLATSASCTVTVLVTSSSAGVKNNSVQVTSTEGGTGNTSNATVTVVSPPVLTKTFGALQIPLNGTTSLTFNLQNNNTTVAITGNSFSDTLPAGLVIATPNGLTGSCGGGTITATAGSNVASLSGATLAASASCTFSVNVTGIAAGTQTNTVSNLLSNEAGQGANATATINVVAPPSIAKAFGAATIPLNGTTSLTFTITNPAANGVAETGVAFTDTLPTGLVIATPNGLTNTCGGTATAVAGSTSISLTAGTIAVNASCTLVVNITGTTSGQYTNTTGAVSSTNGGTGNTATANLTVATPPTIVKVFGAAQVPLNGTTSLTFTIANPNTTVALTGVAFTDNLPAGLVVATPNGLTSTCVGTATAVAGSGSVSLSAGTLAISASCTVSVNVTGTTAGVKNNSVQVTSTEGGTGNTSNASITVVTPPVIIKAFGAASIPLNGTTSLTFTIQNNNTTTTLTGVGFSDTLPAGLVVSTPNGLTGSCGGGTITATQATNVISLTGATLASSTSCTFSINVTGTTAGTQNNTTGNVTSTEGGTGGTASASINVVAPPSIAKAFGAAAVPLNGTTSLTFTITNPAANAVAETGVAFTDTLPVGLVVATPNGLTNTCGGTATAVAGSGSISLTGGTVTASSTCTLTVNITGTVSGSFVNTTGSVSSTNGGTGNTATANISVATPPTIVKAFGAAQIPLNGATSLTFTITNPAANTISLTGIAFTDNLPAGLVVATPNGLTGSCGGGTITAVAGSGSVSLSGATLATSASCTFAVNVQGTSAGVKNNSTQVTSTEGGAGNTTNASITVVAPPVIIKAFGAASVPLNGTTSLTFTIQNNNTTTSLTGVGFSDTFPAGLVVSTPNGLTGSCGGGTITATQATNVVSLTGATIAASSSCTFSVNVTGTVAGTQNNTTGNVTSTEGGTGGTASASINVVTPPSIAKAFNPTGIPLNGVSTLTFTITNPSANAVAEVGVAFTDNFPANLVVATPNGLTNTCGGTATATAGSGSVSLTGGTVAASSTCTLSVNVTSATGGVYANTSGAVSSTNGGTGNTASATLTVAAPPTITKAFGAATIALNASTSLTLSIHNPNSTVALTGVAFTDALPAGLVVDTPSGLTSTCGGTATATAGSSSVSLAAGTLATSATCTISLNVTGTTAGVKNNTTGAISSNESGTGATSNTASITVVAPPVIIKAFGAASVPLNGTTSLTFTIQNNNTTQSLSGIGFTDALPAGLVVSTPNGLTGTCGGGTITAVAGSGNVSLTGATIVASATCTFSVNVTGTTSGTKNNTTGQVTSTEGGTGGTASASLSVVSPPVIAKAFNPTAIIPNGTSTLTLTITNPAANPVAETGVAFTDTFPANLVVATPNGLTNTCGGTATAVAGSGSVSLTGGTVATSSSCTITVTVTSATPGNYTNTTGAVSSTNGGTGNTATATLVVQHATLGITKTHVGNFVRGQTGTYTITVSDTGAGPTDGTTVTVVDTLPAVVHPLTAISMSGTGWTCTLGTLTCTRNDILLAGQSYPAITLTVNVPINITANVTNSVTVSGGGDPNPHTATDPTHMGPPLNITFNGNGISVYDGQSGSVTFQLDTIPNPGPITFSCSGLPLDAACGFSPSTITQTSTTVTLTITTIGHVPQFSTPLSKNRGGEASPLYASLTIPGFGLGLAVVLLGGRKRSKKVKVRLFGIFGSLMLLVCFAGCGSSTPYGTPAGTYPITVTASSVGGDATGTTILHVLRYPKGSELGN